MECKFWINELELTIKLATAFNMASDKINEVADIIYANLQLIINAWHNYFKS
jgi:hypothetical protein